MAIGGWIVLLIALVGLLMYALSSNPKLSQIGYAMFCCGTLAVCLMLGAARFHLP